jgi:hypothetical protein
MDTLSKFTVPGILFVLTLAFGFWLSQQGKPYNGILFNIHKLTALGAVVIAVIQVVQTLKNLNPLSLSALFLLAAICIVALFVSGALMSAGKLDYALMLSIHRVAPVVLGIALVWSWFLLVRLR